MVYLGTRISFSELDSLLPQLPVYKPKTQEEVRTFATPLLLKAAQEPDVVMQELNLGGRNQLLYWVGKRCDELGLPLESRLFFVTSVYSNLRSQDGFTFEEAQLAARCK